jgi:hypothetical protein
VSQWDDAKPRWPDAPPTRPRHMGPGGRGAGAPPPTPAHGTRAAFDGVPSSPVPATGDEDDLVIRPFLLTGGRTRPTRDDLRVESLIQSLVGATTDTLRFEARRIVEICRDPTSIAELSAALRVPLGVVRVLVSDLAAEGRVSVVQHEQLSIQMMERIRDRVRAL